MCTTATKLCPFPNMSASKNFNLLICLIIFNIFIENVLTYQVDNNPYRHIEILDKDGKYQLEWLVDLEESRIIFNVTVRTKGYVGLGLSRKGKMSGADIVIGGVLANGQPYFSDRHAVGNNIPVEDSSQDWVLHSARESNTHTFLSFSRALETCDEDHDLPIHGDVIGIIWAFGENDDDIEYHYHNRGVFYSYLLDPDLTPRELERTEKSGFGGRRTTFGNWKVWTITKSDLMPDKDTTYMCSIHKASSETKKQHAVGFRSILPTETERRHIHHYLLYRCIPPIGQDASRIFEPLLGVQEECYIMDEPLGRIPTSYCTDLFHVWAVGQLPNFFPEHVGLPMFPGEYYMFQVHFDNPDLIPGVELNYSLETFYTENLRQHDAAILFYGHSTPGSQSLLVPPNSLSHEIYGHCGSACTKSMLPPTGIRVFASFFHTHLAGRGVRVLHMRDNKELPWISYDDNFNFNYQQVRLLQEERLILPGDTIIRRQLFFLLTQLACCVYDNTGANGNATVGGYSTSQEMCDGMLWYYDRIPDRGWCFSEIRSPEYGNFLQIRNSTWSNDRIENVVTSPSENAGLLVSEVASLRTDWTLAKRQQLQEYQRHLPQTLYCPSLLRNDEEATAVLGRESWLLSPSQKLKSPRPPLLPYRWALPVPVKKAINSSSQFPFLKGVSSGKDNADVESSEDQQPGTQNTNEKMVSIYPRGIMPYERPNLCSPKN